MASFKSVLSGIGHFLAKAFSPKAVQVEAEIADAALPMFAPLINSAAAAVVGAETAAAAAGVQTGTGPQKLAYAIAQFGPDYDAWAKANNIPIVPANKVAFLSAIADALNLIPAPVPPTTTTAAPPAA